MALVASEAQRFTRPTIAPITITEAMIAQPSQVRGDQPIPTIFG